MVNTWIRSLVLGSIIAPLAAPAVAQDGPSQTGRWQVVAIPGHDAGDPPMVLLDTTSGATWRLVCLPVTQLKTGVNVCQDAWVPISTVTLPTQGN